jgi:hypothetical protein
MMNLAMRWQTNPRNKNARRLLGGKQSKKKAEKLTKRNPKRKYDGNLTLSAGKPKRYLKGKVRETRQL